MGAMTTEAVRGDGSDTLAPRRTYQLIAKMLAEYDGTALEEHVKVWGITVEEVSIWLRARNIYRSPGTIRCALQRLEGVGKLSSYQRRLSGKGLVWHWRNRP